MTPLEKLQTLNPTEEAAFLALFAGARSSFLGARRGDTGQEIPWGFGKAECEWVEDCRDFWGRKLVDMGFVTFQESEPRPAPGMVPGSTCWDISITVTEEGWRAREDYWADWRAAVEAQAAEFAKADNEKVGIPTSE